MDYYNFFEEDDESYVYKILNLFEYSYDNLKKYFRKSTRFAIKSYKNNENIVLIDENLIYVFKYNEEYIVVEYGENERKFINLARCTESYLFVHGGNTSLCLGDGSILYMFLMPNVEYGLYPYYY